MAEVVPRRSEASRILSSATPSLSAAERICLLDTRRSRFKVGVSPPGLQGGASAGSAASTALERALKDFDNSLGYRVNTRRSVGVLLRFRAQRVSSNVPKTSGQPGHLLFKSIFQFIYASFSPYVRLSGVTGSSWDGGDILPALGAVVLPLRVPLTSSPH